MKIVILGAGIAGISAAYHAKKAGFSSIKVFEKSNRIGGLLDNFEINGFRFDHAVHLSFTKSSYVKELFNKTSHHIHQPLAYNFDNGNWIKHPVQNNLYTLPIEGKVEAIESFLQKPNFEKGNYREWLISQYGEYIAEKYHIRYTKKYWASEAESLSVDWVSNRFALPDVKAVLFGAMSDETPNSYYASEMRYPIKGGYKSFIKPMIDEVEDYITLNKNVVLIDEINKYIEFEDGSKEHYDILISSIPLPIFVENTKNILPDLKLLSKDLKVTSVGLVSLGFKKPDIPKHLWFYIYDEDILASRVYSPSLKSQDNVPEGCSSLQFEIYFQKENSEINGNEVMRKIIDNLSSLGINKEDIILSDYREIEYGNVIFTEGMIQKRNKIKEYYNDKDILFIGRFGEWDYLWSDQSLLSGKEVISRLMKN